MCAVEPTDTKDPNYFHRVVDCQWACPAHTDVPEYIRLIALGEFGEAYLVNRESNVFPGILGRVCDRPCEPACRRGRVEEEPVAICRLKRVAADHREDITARLPSASKQKNGKRIKSIAKDLRNPDAELKHKYIVQVGTYLDREKAEKLSERLKA